jgi:FkbM family methyltransferase
MTMSWQGRYYDTLRAVAFSPAAEPILRRAPFLVPHRQRLSVQAYGQVRKLFLDELEPASNCIDVGAYRGDVLSLMTRIAPHGHHLAFEPIPYMAASLRRRFPSVEVHEAAVSDHAGPISFTHVRGRPTYSGILPRAHPGRSEIDMLEVRAVRIDDVVSSEHPPRLVKIDVEGALVQVLRGALETLREHRPIVVFEEGHLTQATYGTTFHDVHRLLSDECELDIFDLDGNGPFSAQELTAITDRADWVARPRER